MPRLSVDAMAPDFTFLDYKGNPFQLSSLRGKFNVLLVFNRGFS